MIDTLKDAIKDLREAIVKATGHSAEVIAKWEDADTSWRQVAKTVIILESLDRKLRDAALDLAKKHDIEITALESRNSSALKATLERIRSKLTDKEVGRYYHRQSMMGNRHKRMVDYALGLALEAVNFEIDSLLQQSEKEIG